MSERGFFGKTKDTVSNGINTIKENPGTHIATGVVGFGLGYVAGTQHDKTVAKAKQLSNKLFGKKDAEASAEADTAATEEVADENTTPKKGAAAKAAK